MTPAEARQQIRMLTAALREQGQDASADHLQRRLRLIRKGRLDARARTNSKAPAGRLGRLPTLRPIA